MPPIHRGKILIVEDNLLNLKKLEEILSSSYILATAPTAREASALAASFCPDLILLDILLPDANGFDLLAALKHDEATANTPVIIISGLISDEDEEKGFLLGAADYIRKPFKDTIIKARIGNQMKIIQQLQAIADLSHHDALTGAYNRRAFDDQLQFEWARAIRDQRELSLLMIDVDRFKSYNDAYGHPQGDLMLQAVAFTAQASLQRTTDLLCRYGGEEFAVILSCVGLDGAEQVAERIRLDIENLRVPNAQTNAPTSVTVSIGLASTAPTMRDNAFDFVTQADHMLYKAKKNGRNQVQHSLK